MTALNLRLLMRAILGFPRDFMGSNGATVIFEAMIALTTRHYVRRPTA